MTSKDRFHDRRKHPIFIHSRLDELPLTMEAFRVYGHLARRASNDRNSAWPSYKTIGECCFRGSYPDAPITTLRRKAIEAVKELIDWNLIEVEQGIPSEHQSNTYHLTDVGEWKDEIIPTHNNARKGRPNRQSKKSTKNSPSDRGTPDLVIGEHWAGDRGTPALVIGEHWAGDRGTPKVNPLEVAPNEVNPEKESEHDNLNSSLSEEPASEESVFSDRLIAQISSQVQEVESLNLLDEASSNNSTVLVEEKPKDLVKADNSSLGSKESATAFLPQEENIENGCQKFGDAFQERANGLPVYRTKRGCNGIKPEFVEAIAKKLSTTPHYLRENRKATLADAKNHILRAEKEGHQGLMVDRYSELCATPKSTGVEGKETASHTQVIDADEDNLYTRRK